MSETTIEETRPAYAAQPSLGDPQPSTVAGALCVRGVSKAFGKRQILEEVDLDLLPGQGAWVRGRNGVGKTTLLRIVSGLLRPDTGTVRLDGLDPRKDRLAYARRIGLLNAGDRGLSARLSVRHNLEFTARVAMLDRAARAEAITAMTATFELDELLDRRVDRISMGQRQRVRLAQAFLHGPTTLLLDEPATSLDDEGLELVLRAVTDVLHGGGIVLWCSPQGTPPPPALHGHFEIAERRLSRPERNLEMLR